MSAICSKNYFKNELLRNLYELFRLEKNFVDNICPNYDLDPEKALYAIKEGILILEPAWIDWESDDYPEGYHEFVDGFDMSCLSYDSEKLKVPKKSFWQKVRSYWK